MAFLEKSRENYLRVTHILRPFSGLEKIDPAVIEKAAKRGIKVHKICEGIILGIGEIGSDKETQGYVDSFKKWWGKGKDIVMMEQRFHDDDIDLTGQVDMIIQTNQGLAIVDIKTSSKPSLTWPAQGSAYAYLARKAKYDIQKVYFVHLNKYGKFPAIHEYPVDDSFFLAIFRTFKHFFHEEK